MRNHRAEDCMRPRFGFMETAAFACLACRPDLQIMHCNGMPSFMTVPLTFTIDDSTENVLSVHEICRDSGQHEPFVSFSKEMVCLSYC